METQIWMPTPKLAKSHKISVDLTFLWGKHPQGKEDFQALQFLPISILRK